MPTTDETFMQLALDEGAQGLGLTSPNPAVGAVIVRDGEVIGSGWHRKAGGPHAEVAAIRDAGENGHSTDKATIYVTLEPCSTTGKTPPCVEAIINAGITRVVVGATDPNPAHAGGGFDYLRNAGVEVVTGVLEEKANHLLRFFAKRITTGLPYIIAKTAATLDGRTTLGPGQSQWISSPESREDVQRWRQQCEAILVGGETFRVDDPSLTLRGKFADGRPQPLRVVFTSDQNLPSDHKLFTDEHADRTRIHRGISLRDSLLQLAEENVSAVLLESGGRLLAHALQENLVDEIILYLAPRIGGGSTRLLPVDGFLSELSEINIERIGPDIRIIGKPEPHASSPD
ncbi:MAG: bifunctional diaminohydroxyphosphoribosylaminopyrimidine deaminase/5-amino-6-(5-phosphoribosylamino)uracil reductase RibD [Verrucomicrobiales bacterium]|nr:bifunctional diaminohydroxyphosphoribosylaminopyrimidine deaminase/5-amino-6-(5-phosphoribosylamino)uracil reductase RibD [Verrucomicrobiales bacterium]